MNFEEYLKLKHLEDCNRLGRILTESEWVKDVLNIKLPEGDGLAYVSVNQWMNGGRNPDGKNFFKLFNVFGPEVLPVLGFELPPDLAKVISRWDKIPREKQKEILQILEDPEKEKMEV